MNRRSFLQTVLFPIGLALLSGAAVLSGTMLLTAFLAAEWKAAPDSCRKLVYLPIVLSGLAAGWTSGRTFVRADAVCGYAAGSFVSSCGGCGHGGGFYPDGFFRIGMGGGRMAAGDCGGAFGSDRRLCRQICRKKAKNQAGKGSCAGAPAQKAVMRYPKYICKGAFLNETHSVSEQEQSERVRCQGRMRRVPGFLPVCLQDFLHRCEPEVRARGQISSSDPAFGCTPPFGGVFVCYRRRL